MHTGDVKTTGVEVCPVGFRLVDVNTCHLFKQAVDIT